MHCDTNSIVIVKTTTKFQINVELLSEINVPCNGETLHIYMTLLDRSHVKYRTKVGDMIGSNYNNSKIFNDIQTAKLEKLGICKYIPVLYFQIKITNLALNECQNHSIGIPVHKQNISIENFLTDVVADCAWFTFKPYRGWYKLFSQFHFFCFLIPKFLKMLKS